MSYSLDTLEYSSLLDLVGRNAQTPMGATMVAELRPYVGRHELDRALRSISETIRLNEEKQVSWSFSGLQDPGDAVAILKIRNATLEPNTLLELARVCNQALFARSSLQPEKEFAPTLWSIVETTFFRLTIPP